MPGVTQFFFPDIVTVTLLTPIKDCMLQNNFQSHQSKSKQSSLSLSLFVKDVTIPSFCKMRIFHLIVNFIESFLLRISHGEKDKGLRKSWKLLFH